MYVYLIKDKDLKAILYIPKVCTLLKRTTMGYFQQGSTATKEMSAHLLSQV